MSEGSQKQRLEIFSKILDTGTMLQARRMLSVLKPAEIADLLESLPKSQRRLVWEMVNRELDGEVLLEVGDEVRASLIEEMDHEEMLEATKGLETDDLVDLLQSFPEAVIHEVLESMDRQNRHRLEAVMSYDEDSAGGLMNIDTVTVRPDVTLEVVLRYLRLRGELPSQTDSLFVVNRYDEYLGVITVNDLLVKEPQQTVGELLDTEIAPINAAEHETAVARYFQDNDLISAPVVDDDNLLLGRITVDDVVDVIREEGEASILSMAGLNEEEDIFAPVFPAARRRAIWLGANLVTAFLASWVIGLFEATLDQVVALAVLMPIVASMGGIAGSQTLTLVIRGLALGQLGASNVHWLLVKEASVGMLNGLLWAAVVAGLAGAWFGEPMISGIIAAALVINLLAGALAGVAIPLILRRLNIDPALAGTVVLTTVTDITGFMAFLGLATVVLL